MKTITAMTLMAMGLAATSLAAEYKGFVEDKKCAGMPEMSGNAECAQKCIKGGSPAVLVTPDGKIFKIANQDKILASAGQNVTVNGKLKGDTLTIDTVK